MVKHMQLLIPQCRACFMKLQRHYFCDLISLIDLGGLLPGPGLHSAPRLGGYIWRCRKLLFYSGWTRGPPLHPREVLTLGGLPRGKNHNSEHFLSPRISRLLGTPRIPKFIQSSRNPEGRGYCLLCRERLREVELPRSPIARKTQTQNPRHQSQCNHHAICKQTDEERKPL